MLPLQERRCHSGLETGVKCSIGTRVKGVAFPAGPSAPIVSSLMAPISLCMETEGLTELEMEFVGFAQLHPGVNARLGWGLQCSFCSCWPQTPPKSPVDVAANGAWTGGSLQVPSNSRYSVIHPFEISLFCSE